MSLQPSPPAGAEGRKGRKLAKRGRPTGGAGTKQGQPGSTHRPLEQSSTSWGLMFLMASRGDFRLLPLVCFVGSSPVGGLQRPGESRVTVEEKHQGRLFGLVSGPRQVLR